MWIYIMNINSRNIIYSKIFIKFLQWNFEFRDNLKTEFVTTLLALFDETLVHH